MNENKTNAPIKLPVRYDAKANLIADTDGRRVCDCDNPAIANQIVAALNEADELRAEVEGYRAMIADEHFCEVNVWSYHPLCHDQLVSISKSNKQWRWYHEETGGLIANSPVFDTLLEAYAAIKPKDAETSGEGTE